MNTQTLQSEDLPTSENFQTEVKCLELRQVAKRIASIASLAAVQGGACNDCCCDLYSDNS